MRAVIDCSIAFKWEVPESGSAKAIRLRDEFRRGVHEFLAPDIFPIEVANALYTAELRGDIPTGRFEFHLADILQSGPILYQSTALLPRANAIIRRSSAARIGIYDCLYVALAQREGCEFITADAKLIRALQQDYPFIVGLDSLP